MLEIRHILVFMSCTTFIECLMEPFIVGGEQARIQNFPHAVFMYVKCIEVDHPDGVSWICGGSIVNERIVLTAAHCIPKCFVLDITVFVGNIINFEGFAYTVSKHLIHKRYNYQVSAVHNDIALVWLKTAIQFGNNVKRIVLMEKPPYFEKAQVAGWGLIDENKGLIGEYLKYEDQWVKKQDSCRGKDFHAPEGTICGLNNDPNTYASRGDSGSALVVRGYIQVGIVSYKLPTVSQGLLFYTDTGYFYKWIETNVQILNCAEE